MIPVWDCPKEVAAFVAHGLGYSTGFGNSKGLGYANETEGIVAGVVYHNWNPASQVIEISAYSSRRNWLNKSRLRAVFSYPFDQLNCRMCIARISEKNTRTLRIWRVLGADFHTIPDLRADGEAEVVAVLRRAKWKNSKFLR